MQCKTQYVDVYQYLLMFHFVICEECAISLYVLESQEMRKDLNTQSLSD